MNNNSRNIESVIREIINTRKPRSETEIKFKKPNITYEDKENIIKIAKEYYKFGNVVSKKEYIQIFPNIGKISYRKLDGKFESKTRETTTSCKF